MSQTTLETSGQQTSGRVIAQ